MVSPGHPDVPGGVTDHTTRVVGHWRAWGHEVEVLGATGVSVPEVVAQWAGRGVEAVLIQYVPFLYGRRGVSRFPERLARALRGRGLRVVTFVHEPWVPATRVPWLVLSPIQRRQLRRLVALSGVVVTPVPAWVGLLGGPTRLLYVGSTLGEPEDLPSGEPPLAAPVVFSPFASGLRWDWIAAAVEAAGSGLLVVGSDREAALKHRVVGRWVRQEWEFAGRLPATPVLRLLARARLALAPYVDGVTGRRTAAMAALSVGAPLLTSSGPLYDPAVGEGAIAVAATRAQFADAARAAWSYPPPAGERSRRLVWYRDRLHSAALDQKLLDMLLGFSGP